MTMNLNRTLFWSVEYRIINLVMTKIRINVNNSVMLNNEMHLNVESFRMLKLPIECYTDLQFRFHVGSFWNIYLPAMLSLTEFIHSRRYFKVTLSAS